MVLDSVAGRQMEEAFRGDLRHAQEVEPAAFRRAWARRVTEWAAANLITPLL